MHMKLLPALLAAALLSPSARAETPEERGAYLVEGPAACGNCHSPIDQTGQPLTGQNLAGRFVMETPEFTAYAPNLTPAGPVGTWSDAELARAIREGIRPDGSVIGPPMPFSVYSGLSDGDVSAIVAYLRTLPAVENPVPLSQYNIPLPPAYGPPVGTVPEVPRGVTAEYGAYLAGPVAHCTDCHTTFGPKGPMLDTHLGRGGLRIDGPWGTSIASNITSHVDGLAGYTDAEVADMITLGKRPDGTAMLPPMPYSYLSRMTDDDLAAIILYLRTLPPLPDVPDVAG
ncbi:MULTISPECIES: c-type cytochrome [unclassified Roseovarius]|uniref:c-type cytochrome n=1 Tax=unclassified Roseovarius TaxID=2614913 RepID=UPI00273FA434|nr:c-type cytochrome [Roseovarius sp. MMSF_3350]